MSDRACALALVSFSPSDLNVSIDGQPRMQDARIAKALGAARPRKIRDLIERHRDALERLGTIAETTATTHSGTRPTVGRVFWLTKKQCLYLCTKSDTPNATEVTLQMVEVFDSFTAGQAVALPPPDPDADLIRAIEFMPKLMAEIDQAISAASPAQLFPVWKKRDQAFRAITVAKPRTAKGLRMKLRFALEAIEAGGKPDPRQLIVNVLGDMLKRMEEIT